MRLLLFISLIVPFGLMAQSQNTKSKRFQKDDKITNYINKPISAYKRGAYLDMLGLLINGSVNVGYYHKIGKNNYAEAGLMIGGLSNKFSNRTLMNYNVLNNFNGFDLVYQKVKIKSGLSLGIHHCLFGNPLSNSVSVGLRTSMINLGVSGDLFILDSTGTPGYLNVKIPQQTISFHPVISLKFKLSRSVQLEPSGFISYNMSRADFSGVPKVTTDKGSFNTFAYTFNYRIIKLF